MTGIRIARVRGIAVTVHWSLLLILPLLVIAFVRVFRQAAGLAKVPANELAGHLWLWGLGLAVALFLSVLIHELAHSLYALKKGGEVREITLLAIGGVSQLTEAPRSPRVEAVMAVVGPLTSIGIGAIVLAAGELLYPRQFVLRFALVYLGVLNLFIGAFNLLPSFPMDGGRILRALLTRRYGRVGATRIASMLGKAFALAFGVIGALTWNFILVFISFFLFMGADAELKKAMIDETLGGVKVADVMSGSVATLPADASLHEAAEQMLRWHLSAIEVLDGQGPIGVVTDQAIGSIPRDQWDRVSVRAAATSAPTLVPEEMATRAAELFGTSGVPLLAVMKDGRLVGTVARDDLERWIKLRAMEIRERDRLNGRNARGPQLPV